MDAGSYQKDALMRSKQTADTFSDFFAFKGSVSQSNLAKMPTTGSLVGGCQQNTPRGEDLFAAYNYVMPRDEIELIIKPGLLGSVLAVAQWKLALPFIMCA